MASTPRTRRRHREAPRKGDLREQAILDTAETLLTDPGPETMTVEDIARGAGISRGSLYFYFGSKNEVLTALVTRTVMRLRDTALIPTADAGLTPREVVTRAVAATERIWHEHGPVMRTAVEYSAIVPEIGQIWSAAITVARDAMTPILIRAGLPSGPGPTDAEALAHAMCWMTERNFYRTYVDDPGQLSRTAATCTAIWHSTLPGDHDSPDSDGTPAILE
ncbi:TetR/AcrR family transcriptional regulator [Nocardia sp. CDC160]|uniref:TetR/AcrR family transcriptional regulator n=1 Tax=Nocardia sp. CDC160 TaxID=3112166 RepID=UPI002DBDA9D5|nr:TetR/AcrR family transcriptional regulator [Nocardia sp. CDC160]MEC3915955.1 TetR/AcrR family transcriptional regulator [Nocardia sp. CDC160]